MKGYLIIFCLCFCFVSSIFSQPTGEERSVNLKLHFLNCDKDKIQFKKVNTKFISLDNEHEVEMYLQGYSYELIKNKENDDFKEIMKKDSILPIDILHKKNDVIKISYYSALHRVGTEEKKPYNDVIVMFKYKKRLMKITLKLYNSKGLFDGGSDVVISIPFKKGTYKITDPKNPDLIKVKN
ncbi:hypothetical protein [uncultured Aquimarina sp.]|uniref:hypothetical protein n=1 Tax=uncultured Aquimarina sp. TaxID=575652 RepID=UPI002609E76A|nr:hypothetical protein [uncultured Aquimarina sp.]